MTGHHGTCQIGGKAFPIGEWTMTQLPPNVSGRPEYLAFVRSMRESPDDDLIRLACADWLQENAQPERAEFIRVQVRWHLLNEWFKRDLNGLNEQVPGWGAEMDRLTERQRALLAVPDWRNAAVWFCWDGVLLQNIWGGPSNDRHPTLAMRPGDPDGADRECLHCALRRGFVESVTCSAADWIQHADAITAAHPVRAVALTTIPRVSRAGDGLYSTPGIRENFEIPHGYSLTYSQIAQLILEMRWPGIEFTLPATPTVGATPNLTAFAASLQPPPA